MLIVLIFGVFVPSTTGSLTVLTSFDKLPTTLRDGAMLYCLSLLTASVPLTLKEKFFIVAILFCILFKLGCDVTTLSKLFIFLVEDISLITFEFLFSFRGKW